MTSENRISLLFQNLLVATWLRPERALFDAYLLSYVREYLGNNFFGPSLEYGCTDGVPTFVALGGEFQTEFDDYISVDWQTSSHINHQGLGTDYFDHFDRDRFSKKIVKKPAEQKITVGLSWKESHLEKAKLLDIYNEHIHIPLGGELDILKERAFETIFAPNLFWIENGLLPSTLRQLRELLSNNGRIITIFPDRVQNDTLIYHSGVKIDKKWMEDLDRGIHQNLTRYAFDYHTWESIFADEKLEICRHDTFLPSSVNYIYQIGFRPMFPVFMNMYDKLKSISNESLQDVKKHWIETTNHFLLPLCDEKKIVEMGQKNTWHIFELRKK